MQAASGFVASQEFQNTYGTLDNAAFVTLLYTNVLQRQPWIASERNTEVDRWVARLEQGDSRAEIVKDLAQSKEFLRETNSDFRAFMPGTGDRFEGGSGDDLLAGTMLADVFDANAASHDRVLHLDAWDTLIFRGFEDDATNHMRERGQDVVFEYDEQTIIFMNTDMAMISQTIGDELLLDA